MMRLYYVGDEHDYTDIRLPGVLLSYGNAVDVHNDELAAELLALPQFSDRIVAARPVFRAEILEEEEPEPESDDLPEPIEEAEDLEVDNDDDT